MSSILEQIARDREKYSLADIHYRLAGIERALELFAGAKFSDRTEAALKARVYAAEKLLAGHERIRGGAHRTKGGMMAEEHLFRKKPVVVQAHHLGENESVEIRTFEGTLQGKPGDWVITGIQGEQYPCKDSIFRATYEPVDEVGNVIPWPGEKRVLRIAHGFPCPACQAHLLLDIREAG